MKKNKTKTFIIAEIGNMHEGSVSLAKKIIKAAKEAGADAVKLQTHLFDVESLKNAINPPYFNKESRESYFNRTMFNFEQYEVLKKFCEDVGCELISSPFSIEAIDLLERVGLKTFKVPSGEVSNIPFLIRLAKTKKRILLSSGMSSLSEIDLAVKTLKKNGNNDIVLMQCTSEYPCPPDHSGLPMITELKKKYGLMVGFSDHTMSTSAIPVAAVVLGAEVIEKHFTLSRSMYGSDAKVSLEPKEFGFFVKSIRELETAINSDYSKDAFAKKLKYMKIIFEKSIVAKTGLVKGQKISEKDLAYKKPGDGIPAKDFRKIIGKRLKKTIKKDHKFKIGDFIWTIKKLK